MYAGIACGPQGARRVVCAFGWKGLGLRSPEPQNESARLLGALAGQSRSKATAAPPSSDDGRYVSTASDAIYRACQVRPHTVRKFVEYRRNARRGEPGRASSDF